MIEGQRVTFEKSYEELVRAAGVFIAALVKEGVTFEVNDDINTITVVITGGY